MEIRGQFFSLRFGPSDLNVLKKLIDTAVNGGMNTICIELEKAFKFSSHPEISAPWAIEKDVFRDIAAYLRSKRVKLIPLLPLFSHEVYILDVHPEFREPGSSVHCVHAPGLYDFLFDLTDEIIEVFNPEYFHIAHDEALTSYDPRKMDLLFKCEKCAKKKAHEIFASDIMRFHKYLSEKNIRTMMWADCMLNPADFADASFAQSGCYGGAPNNLHRAIDLLPKDIVMCDWHYEPSREFPTVAYLQKKGFETLGCPKYEINSFLFTDYAYRNRTEKFKGMLGTSWCNIIRENFRPLNDIVRKNAFFFSNPGKAFPDRKIFGNVKKICRDYNPVINAKTFHGVYDFKADGNGIYHSRGWRDLTYMEWPSLGELIVPPRYPSSLNIKAGRYGYIDYKFSAGKNLVFDTASVRAWLRCPGKNRIIVKSGKKSSAVLENKNSKGALIDISSLINGSRGFEIRFEVENLGKKREVFMRKFEVKAKIKNKKEMF